jgi:hypothetical protein
MANRPRDRRHPLDADGTDARPAYVKAQRQPPAEGAMNGLGVRPGDSGARAGRPGAMAPVLLPDAGI